MKAGVLMATDWMVVDSEGRVYGRYRSYEAAQEAAASASRGFPWRLIEVVPA